MVLVLTSVLRVRFMPIYCGWGWSYPRLISAIIPKRLECIFINPRYCTYLTSYSSIVSILIQRAYYIPHAFKAVLNRSRSLGTNLNFCHLGAALWWFTLSILRTFQRINLNITFIVSGRKNLKIANEMQEHRVKRFISEMQSNTHTSTIPKAVMLVGIFREPAPRFKLERVFESSVCKFPSFPFPGLSPGKGIQRFSPG
jgi:hypothetical protein